MYKIAIVTQYLIFAQNIETIKAEFDKIDIKIFYDKNKTITELAQIAEKENFEAIICGGFSYDALIGKTNLPLVSAEPSLYDIIDALFKIQKKLRKNNSVILLPLFYRNVLCGENSASEYLNRLFDVNIIIVKYRTLKEYERYLYEYKDKVDALVGGAHSVAIFTSLEIENELLIVGRNTMKIAIEEAIRSINIRKKEEIKNKQLKAMLNSSYEGIIYVNRDLSIELINSLACTILGIFESNNLMGSPIRNIIDSEKVENVIKTGISELGYIYTLSNENKILMNMVPVVFNDEIYGIAITFKEITEVIEMERKIRADLHKKGVIAKYYSKDIIGESEKIRKCKDLAKKFSKFEGNVLIYGETGTGKELFAQSIHNESTRKTGPFYAINCAALPEQLLESELFGYTEGAFTGAKKGGKTGIFELAHGGTVYLDEIGEMTLSSQSSFLRVLQEKEVRKIGDEKVIPVDVRIIAATHKNLYKESMENRFREDLYYRLNVLSLTIPSLRERVEDIPILLKHFINIYSGKYKLQKKFTFDDSAIALLQKHPWRGNIRELQNLVERLYAYGDLDNFITEEELKMLLSNFDLETATNEPPKMHVIKNDYLNKLTKNVIEEAIEKCRGNKTQAAKYLGVSRTYIWRKLYDNK